MTSGTGPLTLLATGAQARAAAAVGPSGNSLAHAPLAKAPTALGVTQPLALATHMPPIGVSAALPALGQGLVAGLAPANLAFAAAAAAAGNQTAYAALAQLTQQLQQQQQQTALALQRQLEIDAAAEQARRIERARLEQEGQNSPPQPRSPLRSASNGPIEAVSPQMSRGARTNARRPSVEHISSLPQGLAKVLGTVGTSNAPRGTGTPPPSEGRPVLTKPTAWHAKDATSGRGKKSRSATSGASSKAGKKPKGVAKPGRARAGADAPKPKGKPRGIHAARARERERVAAREAAAARGEAVPHAPTPCFDGTNWVGTPEVIEREIGDMDQKSLQARFEAVYGKATNSNNNAWLRRKLLEASGLRAPPAPRSKGRPTVHFAGASLGVQTLMQLAGPGSRSAKRRSTSKRKPSPGDAVPAQSKGVSKPRSTARRSPLKAPALNSEAVPATAVPATAVPATAMHGAPLLAHGLADAAIAAA